MLLSLDQFPDNRHVPVINMRIRDHMYQFPDLHIAYLRQHMRQHRILADVPVVGGKHILRTLV